MHVESDPYLNSPNNPKAFTFLLVLQNKSERNLCHERGSRVFFMLR